MIGASLRLQKHLLTCFTLLVQKYVQKYLLYWLFSYKSSCFTVSSGAVGLVSVKGGCRYSVYLLYYWYKCTNTDAAGW
jgi:hypothetical protein